MYFSPVNEWELNTVFVVVIVVILLVGITMRVKRRSSLRFLHPRAPKLSPELQSALYSRSPYYRKLSKPFQKEFETRVVEFLGRKSFIARGDKEVTEEMKLLISATAVQICFGLPSIVLENFEKILIYPDAYFSTIRKEYHIGETNPGMGIIVLSWKAFEAGIANPNDGKNLGIHEMAHALQFENRIYNDEYDFFEQDKIARWEKLAKAEINAYVQGGHPVFREYGFTNEVELFAVATEYFFEKPDYFHREKPELFDALMRLLNQDILRIYGYRN